MPTKWCAGCSRTRQIKFFGKCKGRPLGLAYYCKSCAKNKNRKFRTKNPRGYKKLYTNWRKKNPLRLRSIGWIRYWPNLTNKERIEQYEKLFKNQKGKCKLCKKYQNKYLAVDHCHRTKKVRGLLCNSCNLAVGHIETKIKIINKILKYIK